MNEELSSVDLRSARIELRPDGVLHIDIKLDQVFEIEDSIAIIEARTKLVNGKRTPIVYTCTEFVIPSKEVREFVASEKRSELVIADAFVVNSLPQKLVANLFIKINKPVRPTKVFSNFDEACEWAKTFIPML
ncbi:DUF7793 family protein [Parvicella tangerina]|uniref:DUF7793 domain-containing protein n=1 Tax=Parvicella tangerina TaxID=2829795 RepID=A0A916JJ30_9FLAO|nr:hypothetical protein [Parvicella tangerina]CAG5076285.1 hypothetical protein CRYO30217_00040 [Parvicella tangerina]